MNGRKMKRFLVVLLTFCILMTQGGMMAFATEGATTNSNGVPEGIILNYHETAPIDSSFAEVGAPVTYSTLPTSYSASKYAPMEVEVQEDHVSPVKDQGSYGTCWAHSAISIAESSYIINEKVASNSVDYNEYHLVHYGFGAAADSLNLFGGDYNSYAGSTNILEEGGSVMYALCTLASWQGASDASQSEFGPDHIQNNQTPESILGTADAAHMENGYILTMPDMTSDNYLADMNVIKKMIMEYGSVSISYYAAHTNDYYQGYYQYCYDENATNHAVTIVGWDDTVSASNFKTAPAGDGAWIVKNSWGDWWGANGYFYLSYYDATIEQNAFAFDFVSGDNYDNNYQYDGTGNYYGTVGGGYGQVTAANAFVADSNETLKAVGFYTRSINNDYEIRIYRGLEEGANPNTGTLVHTQSGSQTYVGYHTVELNTEISVEKGERYAVVITLKGDADQEMRFSADVTDLKGGAYIFSSSAKAGESYVGTDVSTLTDLNPDNTDGYYMGRNVRIKAFTDERSGSEEVKVTSVTLDYTTYSMEKGDSVTFNAVVTPASASNVKVTWSSSNDKVASVDQFGNVRAVAAGTAVITATTQDGSGVSASCTVTVTEVLAEDLAIVVEGEVVSYYRIESAGSTQRFYAAFTPEDTTNTDVVWTSSNTEVATIDENGWLKSLKGGLTVITATAKDGSGVSATCLVAVQHIFVSTFEITLNGQATDYIEASEIGKKYDLDAKITPEESAMFGVKWESSDTSVATVDQNGVVTILSDGETTITAMFTIDYTYTADCYIEVDATQTTFEVQHYVMNVNGEYELAKTETKTQDKEVYTYSDFVKSEYNDGQTLCFSHMKENGYPVTVFYPNEDGTSVIQLYYERQMTPVYVLVELEGWSSQCVLQEAYYVGYTASIDANWIKEKTKDSFGRTGEMEIQNVIVEQGNTKVTLNNGKYSFVTPVNTGGVMISFVVAEKITYKVEHHVMNENGSYVLAKSETLKGYQKDSYPVKNLIKSEYNTGDTYFKTLTVNNNEIAGLNINTSIRLEDGAVVKVYYDRVEEEILDGWYQAEDGNWYYYKDGEMQKEWQYIDGKWYYLGSDGARKHQWQYIGKKYYYLGIDGVMRTGWQKISKVWYYFDANGAMQTGWLILGKQKYYLKSDGAMVTGIQTIESKKYYFDANGVMKTGWIKYGGKTYYFGTDGVMQTGWKRINSKWYYFAPADGAMKIGWLLLGKQWYYLDANGVMQTGWENVGGKWYYMNSDGVMQTGWEKIGSKWYYMNSNGEMQTGWLKLANNWYYLNPSGDMVTGWKTINGVRYYFDKNGVWIPK